MMKWFIVEVDEIISDLKTAIDLGIDHICVYNLVCYPEHGTEWALDPKMQHMLPSKKERIQNVECGTR